MTTAPPPVDAGRHDHGRRPLGRVNIDRRGELLDSRPDIGDHRADELPARSLGPVAGRGGFPYASNGQLAQPSDALKKAHGDSFSVVPDVASSGDVATVELSVNAARTMASPRRVVGSDERHAAHAYLVGYLSQVLAMSGRDMQGLVESLRSRGRHVEADLLAADQEAVAR